MPVSRRTSRGEGLLWALVAAGTTGLLLLVRTSIEGAHVALAYLLIILGASARGGRHAALLLSVACFLAFNFFFLEPRYTLAIHNPLDWLVLIAFLVTSAVATLLLDRARSAAADAEQRAREIDRIATLGAEALNAGRADDAVLAVAEMVRGGLGMARCAVYLQEPGAGQLRRIAASEESATIGIAADGNHGALEYPSQAALLLSADARTRVLPLRVRDRLVGMLRVESREVMALDAAQERFLRALAFYAALALERVRLASEAEHAEALREADRLKDALLASVSHDLRTPLTTIRAVAQDLAQDGDARALEIVEESDRLNGFVSDLLDLSRLSSGAPEVALELVAAEDVVGAALQQVSGAWQGRTIEASLPADEPLLVGRFDFVHTLRALVNLLDNALKYSPVEAPVELEVRRREDHIAFAIADRGPGVPVGQRERIFEPFYRADEGRGTRGTGLGLAIARRSAELQGGEVRYEPRPGGGSVFTLLVPAAAPDDLAGMSL